MPNITFTQYMRPNGRPVPVIVDRPEKIAAKAKQLSEAGYKFECEVLMTGNVAFTISNGEVDCAIEICKNGPEAPHTVDRLIEGFNPPKEAE